MIARPAATSTKVSHGTRAGSSSGSCAMKIRIASALTKPVITDLDTKRMTAPSFSTPAAIWIRPARTVAASR